jgi:hypothetical protein
MLRSSVSDNKLRIPLDRAYAQQKKIKRSGSKAQVKADNLKALWLQCCPGPPWESAAPESNTQPEQGRTPVGSVSGPKRKRAALPPTVPRLVDSQVGRRYVSIEDELQHAQEENLRLRDEAAGSSRAHARADDEQARRAAAEQQVRDERHAAQVALQAQRNAEAQAAKDRAARDKLDKKLQAAVA